jgi:hypothetical protein
MKIMTTTHIPIKFKQIVKDNFPTVPEDALILPLITVSGSKQVVDLDVIRVGLDWLENHGETMEAKSAQRAKKVKVRFKPLLAMLLG